MTTSTHQKLRAVLIAVAAAATLGLTQAALAAHHKTLAPICDGLQEGDTCGPPSLKMACQRQGNGGHLVCRHKHGVL
jgi:hypothetical protein